MNTDPLICNLKTSLYVNVKVCWVGISEVFVLF